MASDTVGKDPSMDEILQSIKRIISEEGDGIGKQEDDVLELTDMVHDDGSVVSLTGGDVEEQGAPVLDEIEDIDVFNPPPEREEVAVEPEPEVSKDLLEAIDDSITAHNQVEDREEGSTDIAVNETVSSSGVNEVIEPEPISSLISNAVAVGAMEKIHKFAETVDAAHAVGGTDPLKFRAGTTVEDLVVEAIKPMLSNWLDLNLNQIVESVIERELRRITGR